jgi:hypothetical protein
MAKMKKEVFSKAMEFPDFIKAAKGLEVWAKKPLSGRN